MSGAAIIAAGGLVSKLLGALYRIPLAGLLGGEGMGIYQMVYPLYCILLTLSASGIPASIARLAASGERGVASQAFRTYAVIGGAGSIALFVLGTPLALAQGIPAVELCCRLLSPAVFFVSLLAVVRGWFQGANNMAPTAVTEVLEQLIKVGVGLFLATHFSYNLTLAVASTLFAVTVSEAVCALYAVMLYRTGRPVRTLCQPNRISGARILKYTLPLTVTAIAMPLSQLAESIVAVRLLRAVTADAVALYGIYSGCALTIINLPVSLTYGIAAASIPAIAPLSANGRGKEASALALKSLFFTFALSVPCAIGLAVFAPLAVRLIFRSLGENYSALLIRLVRIMSVNAVTLSLVQTGSACLNALKRPLVATAVQWFSCILRVVLSAVFIARCGLLAEGAAIAANVAYFVAAALELWYIIRKDIQSAGRQSVPFGLKRRKA